MCIEAITYAKIGIYAARLPPEVLGEWRAPAAVRALLQLEDGAEEDYVIALSRPGQPVGPGDVIGEHRSLKADWLGPAYRRIGQLLHAPNPNLGRRKREDPKELRAFLEGVVGVLDPVVASTVTANFAMVAEFPCGLCGAVIKAAETAARKRGFVLCLSPECRAKHDLVEEAGQTRFRLHDRTFTCAGCGATSYMPERRFAQGRKFTCKSCGLPHRMLREWRYEAVKEGGSV